MKRYSLKLAAALITLAAAAPAWALPGRPVDVSLDGHRSDFLFRLTTISISVLFAIMVLILLWSAIVHRARPGHRALYDHGMSKKHLALTAIVASVIFFGVDGTSLLLSFPDLYEAFLKFPTKAENPVEVEVYGQQWAWNFRYAGPDGKFNTPDDVLTLNEMHVPLDRPVLLRMKSKDVIHSFYLPNMRIKQDVFPGAMSQMWFQALKPGHFEIGCAQHCGVNHYKMRGFLTIESADSYAQWIEEQSAASKRRFDEADADAHWGWDWEI